MHFRHSSDFRRDDSGGPQLCQSDPISTAETGVMDLHVWMEEVSVTGI